MYENVEINSSRWFDSKDLLNEEWRDYDYNGKVYYQISNYGRCKSKTRNRTMFNGVTCKQIGKIIKGKITSSNRLVYNLSFDGKRVNKFAHRLVAYCFLNKDIFKCYYLENYKNINKNLLEINHKDENTLNNKVDNLEWCTHLYNINYGTRTKRVIDNTSKKIEQYTLEGYFIKEWDSLAIASNELNISRGTLCSCLKGDIKSCGGFQWKYKNSNKNINKYKSNIVIRKIIQLDLDNNVINIFDNLHEAERKTGVWMTQIRKCCNKEPMYNTAKGYKWCWESDYNGKQ